MERTDQIKMAISGSLTVLAVVFALLARRPWCWLAALAMAVSSIGDGLLAGCPACFRPVKNRLIKGGLVFFAAHILYILALIRVSGQGMEALMPHFGVPFLIFALLIAIHGYLYYFRAASQTPLAFFAAATCYLLSVGIHAATAVCVYTLTGGALILNVIGAVLFFLSDAILMARKYVPSNENRTSLLVWLTYVPAQLCLILGFFLA
ncbi:MAG: hypothetical protein IKO52_00370 [Clostridia bacterium]|nr:hypothetical protein [Clostridia bacterium]